MSQALAVQLDPTGQFPALLAPDAGTAKRVLEFFTANIRNPHTRRAYGKATFTFAHWCQERGLGRLADVQPVHVAAYLEELDRRGMAAPSIKLQLAAIRMLFDWLVVGQIVPANPASVVRGPRHVVRKGKTPVLTAGEARSLLDSLEGSGVIGLRDRALIGLMTFAFARVSAAAEKMRVEDVYVQGRRMWVRLHEKGGKRHEMPCHHKLEAFLQEYIEAAGLARDAKGYLFRTAAGRSGRFTTAP